MSLESGCIFKSNSKAESLQNCSANCKSCSPITKPKVLVCSLTGNCVAKAACLELILPQYKAEAITTEPVTSTMALNKTKLAGDILSNKYFTLSVFLYNLIPSEVV